MNYFSKNKKWTAYLILLTFLFTCVMPSNLGSMNSMAEAAEDITLMQGEAKNIESLYAGGKLEWESKNSNVVEVSGNGDNNKTATITAKAQGKATITAYTGSGKTKTVRDTWEVTVSAFEAEKVDTFDTKAAGVSITMKDLENNQRPFTDGPFGTGFMTPDLVKRTLTSGYPVLKSNGTSLINCFNGEDVTGLFLKSKYDADGTFYYNSFENAAILEGTVLQPYKQLMTPQKNNNDALYARGNFLPYNHFPASYDNNKVGRNLYNEDGSDLNKDAARYNEALFIPADNVNFHFGMMVSASFAQPKDGQISGKNMVFKFNGDDDLWVFIDDALVLDIGGIHIAQKGTIDFATGEVDVNEVDQRGDTKTHKTTIKAQFLAAAEEDKNFTYDETVFDGDTFADFTKHEIKIFYMERGEGASDLKMEFNLPTFSGNPELQKLVEVNDAFVNDSKGYQFKIEVADNATGEGATLYTDKASIVRQNGKVENITNVSGGIVNLKHGELAALNVAEGKYVHVKELNGNTNFTKHHVIQKPKTVLEDRDEDSGKGTESDWHQVSFKNDENKLVEQRLFYQFFNTVEKTDLSITKQLDKGLTDTNTEFQFKVYFKNSVGENDLVKQMPNWTLYQGKLGDGSAGRIDQENGVIYLKDDETAVLKDIPVGTEYFITEVLNGSEYVVKEANAEIAISENDKTVKLQGVQGKIENTTSVNVTITNTKQGSIEFTKTDGTNPLAGAKFSLYSDAACTDAVSGYTKVASDGQGKVTFANVPYGTYYLKEVDPDSTADGKFTVNGKTYSVKSDVYTVAVGASVTISDAAGNQIADKKVVNNEVTTEISGEKIWANVPDTVTKPSVTIGLYDGTTKVKEVTLDGTTDSNGEYEAWKYKVTVPKYKNGTEIDYTVKEIDVGNVSVTENTTKTDTNAATGYYNITVNGKNITNSYVKDVTATKTWNDGNAQNRPAIEVKLYNGSAEVEVKPTTVTDGNVTTYTWTGVPANGTYTVKEYSVGEVVVPYEGDSNVAVVTVAGQKYKVENNGLTITNTLLTDISGTKTWKNATNTWPTGAAVTVGLYADNNAVTVNGVAVTDTLTGDDAAYSFTNLPRYTSGSSTPIDYTVKELGANGAPADTVTVGSDTYKVSYDGNNIINTLTGDADITVTKTWVDDNNRDGLREAITVVLQQKVGSGDWADVDSLPNYNNAAQQVKKEIARNDKSDNMSHTWYNVPLYTDNGAEILYRVVENPVEGYTASYANTVVADVYKNGIGAKASDRVVAITNTHQVDTARIKIEKAWDDKGLTVDHADLIFDIVGRVGENVVYKNTVTLNSDNEWAAFENVPKNATGQAITYLISERNVPEGYEVSYKLNNASVNSNVVTWNTGERSVIGIILAWLTGESKTDGIDCHVKATNTLQTAGIKLTKAYSGGIFNGQTNVTNGAVFTLTGNGETITLTRSDDVYATTSAALKYGVVYTLHENVPTGYTPAADQYLKLVKVDDAYKVVACDVNGNVLTDDKAAAYSLNSGDIADLGTITNYVVKGSFVFTKAFNSTPATPAFTVYEAVKNGDVYTRGNAVNGAVSNEGVVYTISDLECGKSYEVVETAPGYEPVTFYLDVAESSGVAVVTLAKTLVANTEVERDSVWTINNGAYTLTNQAKTTQLILTKTYDGQQENKVGTGTAVFNVYKDVGYANLFASVTFNEASNNYTFTGLEYGKTYYVKESAPAGFASVTFTITVGVTDNGAVVAAINGYTANQDGSYTVNNEIKTTSLTFDKVYVGPQPDAKATFNVTNNKDDAKATLEANAEGKYTMSNLKYGYTYSVVEKAPTGYVPVAFTVEVSTDGKLTVSQAKGSGFETLEAIENTDGNITVKNYLQQDTVDLFGTKSWVGGTTDSAIEIKLFRDGVEQATTATSIEFHWKYIFAGLERFNLETGEAYEYAVEETLVNGFTAYYDETVTANGIQIDITNVKDAEMIAISGQKVWHDVAGTEHEPITVVLYRSIGDGKEEAARVTLNGEEEWKYDFGLLPKADPDSHIYYKYEVEELNVPEGYVSVVNGYDIHNIATPLYELGEISVTKKVEGTPENPNAAYDFVLYVKATVKGTLDSAQQKLQAVLAADYLNLRDTELPEAEEAAKTAQTAFENSVFLTATSSSVYQYFLTDNTDNAVIGLTTGSAYYVEHVNVPLESQQSEVWNNFSNMVGALVAAIEDLAEEFLNAVAEDPAKAKPTQSVMLSRIAQDKDVERIKATTTSAIAFDADKLQGLFDSVVEHKTTLQEFKDAEAAWNAFDESVTTPTAIILIVNGDFDTPIELDPEKGHQSETDETILEFTVENGKYTETVRFNTATGQYEIPFTLLKDETIKFNMKAATGSAIEYYITETKPVDDYYDHTDIKAYLYNGSAEDLEDTLQKEEFLWEKRLTSETSKLTSGSAATYEFYNHYKEDTPPPGGGDYTPPYTPPVNPPKDPEEVFDDPEVPLDKPEIPEEQVVIPGEELEDPEIPLGDAPATGDTTQAVPFVALMMFALAGLVITRKKFN